MRGAATVVFLSLLAAALGSAASRGPQIGVRGPVGVRENPRRVQQLNIEKPGVYDNYLVDGEWASLNLVRIRADGVTLRNSEIRNSLRNGIVVSANNVLIENCKIHHLLAGGFADQADAHGITGRPRNLIIRNCEIYLVSGDAIQFDPGRGLWDNVLIENCTLWTGPLPADAAGFKKGERPGENAVDTKQSRENPRSKVTIRRSVFYGWGNGQISNMAALNLKENVEVKVEQCLFRDNEICFRLRGDAGGENGGALVTVEDCAVYRSDVAVRMENGIRDLRFFRLGIGEGIATRYVHAGGGPGPGYVNKGEMAPPAFEELLRNGFAVAK